MLQITNEIAALRAAQLLDAPQFCRAPAASGKGACKGAKRLRKFRSRPAGRDPPGCNVLGMLLPHPPEQITAH